MDDVIDEELKGGCIDAAPREVPRFDPVWKVFEVGSEGMGTVGADEVITEEEVLDEWVGTEGREEGDDMLRSDHPITMSEIDTIEIRESLHFA